jgi:hypothetical protein
MVYQLRPRTSKIKPDDYTTSFEPFSTPSLALDDIPARPTASDVEGLEPPVYTIDLSLPPAQRYVNVVRDHWDALQTLTQLFDDVLDCIPLPNKIFHFLARMLLRKVYSPEQTEELKGISKAANIPMHLIVAYNVLLDLFMGCTSGGARVQVPESREPRMLHFRTLDWDMSELRNVLVQFTYIARPGGAIIARTISYVGLVGVLTGVKSGLSTSLNFRPYHNNDTNFFANAKFRFQQLAVLLGWQPSIASLLRDFILPRSTMLSRDVAQIAHAPRYTPADISTTLPSIRSTAAYLIFTTPVQTTILEKDRVSATIHTSSTFIAATNHDAAAPPPRKTAHPIGMQDLIDESEDRKRCLTEKRERWRRRRRGRPVEFDILREWMTEYPTVNECTHYVCVMDPGEGVVRWVVKWDTQEEWGNSDRSKDSE